MSVVPLPGASSAAAALSVAGDARAQGFRFVGFLPTKAAERRAALDALEQRGSPDLLFTDVRMPGDGGLALLEDTLTHWRTNARLLQVMIGWWLEQPPSTGATSLPTTFSQSLYDVLMHQRNIAWRDRLAALPAGRYVVAVGALHLYGEGNLPELMQ